MKIIVTGKNINVSDKIQEAIDKKFEKFGKYFADDTRANIVMHPEKDKVKLEAQFLPPVVGCSFLGHAAQRRYRAAVSSCHNGSPYNAVDLRHIPSPVLG